MSETSRTRAEVEALREKLAHAYAEGWAAKQVPMPTVTRPKVVTLSNGASYRADTEGVEFSFLRNVGWDKSSMTLADIDLLASLRPPERLHAIADAGSGPTETVEVEE